MVSARDSLLKVVHEAGFVATVHISSGEYASVLAFIESGKGGPPSNKAYYGVDFNGLRYSVMIGTETLAVFLDYASSSQERLVEMVIGHEKGGEAMIVVTEAEYDRIIAVRERGCGSFSNWAVTGKDANGNIFRIMMGTQTVGLHAWPVKDGFPGDL